MVLFNYLTEEVGLKERLRKRERKRERDKVITEKSLLSCRQQADGQH